MRYSAFLVMFALMAATGWTEEAITQPTATLHELSVRLGDRSIRISTVIFASKDFSIRVIDNATAEDAAKFLNLDSAMESNGCVAGCNGGFFSRKPFAPVGGMISDGRQTSAVDSNSWMIGLLVVQNGQPSLSATDSFQPTPDITDLLQSGTWLVRAGLPETDSSRPQVARRTFVCHDGKGTWAIGASERCTLLELAKILKSPEITAIIDIQEALNFDGGPSTGLWCKKDFDNFYLAEKWAVRNFIGISPRSTP